jgi:hypothetical protein
LVVSSEKLISFSAGFNSMKKLELLIPDERLRMM